MTIGFFLACILGSAIGTVLGVAMVLMILLWLDAPMRKTQEQIQEDLSWLHQMDGRRN